MTIQTYSDVTFLFGPPSGDRYEMLKQVASKTGKSLTLLYQISSLDGVQVASIKVSDLRPESWEKLIL